MTSKLGRWAGGKMDQDKDKDLNIKLNIDSIITRLLEVRGSKPCKSVNLGESEIRGLCLKSKEVFLSQPILLELDAPLKAISFLHGFDYIQNSFQ